MNLLILPRTAGPQPVPSAAAAGRAAGGLEVVGHG